jgi:hypothetical protein
VLSIKEANKQLNQLAKTMNDQRTENQKRLDEWLFHLQLDSKLPVFAWLYLIGDHTIQIHHDTQAGDILSTDSISHQQVIEFAKAAYSAEIITHDIADKFPLGLLLIWGNRNLAACNINPEKNRLMLFVAHQNQWNCYN